MICNGPAFDAEKGVLSKIRIGEDLGLNHGNCRRLDTDLSELAELGGSGKRAAMAQAHKQHQHFSCCVGRGSWEKLSKVGATCHFYLANRCYGDTAKLTLAVARTKFFPKKSAKRKKSKLKNSLAVLLQL
jgi:hypothetical protein